MNTASQIDISKALEIPGWMSKRELVWLAENVRDKKRIVEFGCFYGRSTRALADNSPEDAIICAVDPWNGDYADEDGRPLEKVNTYVLPHFKRNLKDHISSTKVRYFRTYSYNFDYPEFFDFVFIDGDHRYETVKKDIEKAILLLGENKGIIAGHDYGHQLWTGVKQAVDEIFGYTEVEDSIWSVRF